MFVAKLAKDKVKFLFCFIALKPQTNAYFCLTIINFSILTDVVDTR